MERGDSKRPSPAGRQYDRGAKHALDRFAFVDEARISLHICTVLNCFLGKGSPRHAFIGSKYSLLELGSVEKPLFEKEVAIIEQMKLTVGPETKIEPDSQRSAPSRSLPSTIMRKNHCRISDCVCVRAPFIKPFSMVIVRERSAIDFSSPNTRGCSPGQPSLRLRAITSRSVGKIILTFGAKVMHFFSDGGSRTLRPSRVGL
jgi:hypothetical protein